MIRGRGNYRPDSSSYRTSCPSSRTASGAIANRLLILQMTHSFLGREDRALDGRLRAELPGILAWALDGLDRLNSNGRFTVPESSEDAANLMMDLASPVSAFVRECCVRKPIENVTADRLYDAWKLWAENNGHHGGAKTTFGRNLRAVVPELKLSQPTIGSLRVRTYVGIGLLPVHPVQEQEPPDQNSEDADKETEITRADPVQAELPDPVCTGCSNPIDDENPQVNAYCTGCTGGTAFKAQHRSNGAVNHGRFTPDPPCFYCDKPVTGKQTNQQGRYAHLSCQPEEVKR